MADLFEANWLGGRLYLPHATASPEHGVNQGCTSSTRHLLCSLVFLLLSIPAIQSQVLFPVGLGWANNSVNTAVFRQNSLITHNNTQFIAYYDGEGYMVLGKRELNSPEWILNRTPYKGNVADAHNVISIMVDGDGYLHAAWDHHGTPLRYARGKAPLSLDLGDEEAMTGQLETHVTYPQFFRLPDGDLIFMYRDGQSGNGNLVLNHYNTKSKTWEQKQHNLIDGEGERNAYWQACVDDQGIIHISWVWRESWDVATNHDLCYARSVDKGNTWEKSDSTKYTLPITTATAEYICHIPQNSELINQTAMTTDKDGDVYITTYWRNQDSAIPQYHIVYSESGQWKSANTGFRHTPFSLSGGGTKSIPISRPQLVVDDKKIYLIFRDEEYGNKAMMAVCDDLSTNQWHIAALTDFAVGQWEPTYDTELWRKEKKLHLFVQNVQQVDGEGIADVAPQTVSVLVIEGNLLTNGEQAEGLE